MWLYFKAIREAHKLFNDNKKPGDYYTAEFGIGYAITHYPLFMVEVFFESITIAVLICFFAK